MTVPSPAPSRPPFASRANALRRGLLAVCVGSLLPTVPAMAQNLQTPVTPPPTKSDTPVTNTDEQIGFAADNLQYDYDNEVVTATGNVQLEREGNRLRADQVVWYRKTGQVVATGNVATTDTEGNIAYGDKVDVTDTLRDGVVENMLVVLKEGGRLAAMRGTRKDGIYYLDKAVYSACPVVDDDGCPKEPTWQIKAVKVTYNPERARVSYVGARIEFFGLPLILLPGLSHPVGDTGGGGLLVPQLGIDRVNGLEFSLPYYIKLAPNRDVTITPHLYSNAVPMLEGNYRALTGKGAYQVSAYGTYSARISPTGQTLNPNDALRGYIDGAGRFQLTPEWSVSGSLRLTTDRTFLRRYDISRDDRLRSTVNVERIGQRSYLSVAGWYIQTLRPGDPQGQVPIALPVIDYRLRLADPILGGNLKFQANSLAITRTDGQDSQRAFAAAEWNLRRITPWGQELLATAYLRGDVYHSSQNALTSVIPYRGDPGWQTRGIAALALDARWPFIGQAFGGTQRITPRIQVVAAPKLANLSVPNEDARAVELEDSNLFALNRFPGYDRFEDSTRVTYGFEYRLDVARFSLESIVGQSYRLDSRPTILPEGTGLSDRTSDIVGRTTLRYRDFIQFTHRFRLDKDSLAVRRNEIDATVGSRQTYVMVGYLRLNRDVAPALEDLRDREELRLGGRVQFAKYWSVFGSTVIDLTDANEDPTSVADGYEPVRHRLGIAYQDDCLEFGVTWRRDYQTSGDARQGNSFLLRLAFRNLGI